MFRKDPGAIEEWSPENVTICYQRQRRIIADIWPSLKPGGILIYSTCTYNLKEDEENIEWIKAELGAESLSVDVPMEWGITGNLAGTDILYTDFLPHKTKGEGFFLAALRKTGDEEVEPLRVKPSKKNKKKNRWKFPGKPNNGCYILKILIWNGEATLSLLAKGYTKSWSMLCINS